MGDRAVEHDIAAQPLGGAPGAPLDQGVVVDPAGRKPDAGDEAGVEPAPQRPIDALRVPAEQPGRIGRGQRRGPGGAVPGRHLLADQGGEAIEAAAELAGGADAQAEPGLPAIVGIVRLVGAQRGPGEIVECARVGAGVCGAAHAHGPPILAAEIVGEGAAEAALIGVPELDRALRDGARAVRRLPFDLKLDGVLLRLALLVHAEELACDIEADAPRIRPGGALDEGGIVQRRAEGGVDVAGDQRDAALRVAHLGLDLLEAAERGLADPEIAHVEIAQAEVEYLVEVLVLADDLGVAGGTEIGKDAVLAEHQEQGLVGARAVGAAGEAVERLGLRGLRGIRARQRGDGVDDEAADDGDGGADERLAEQARGNQRRHEDGGHDHGELEQDAQRILVAAVAGHGAERDDLPVGRAGSRPRPRAVSRGRPR